MKALLVMIALAISAASFASPPRLSDNQTGVLEFAAQTAAQYESLPSSAPSFTQIFEAILFQESSFCKRKKERHPRPGKPPSFGCGQLQVRTAIKMAHHKLTRRQLSFNNQLNIKLAAQYLHYCLVKFDPDWQRGIVCYNKGEFQAAAIKHLDHDSYLRAITERMHELDKLPQSTD